PTAGNTSAFNDQVVSLYAAGNGAGAGGAAANPGSAYGAALTLYGDNSAFPGQAALDASGASGAISLRTLGTERLRVDPAGGASAPDGRPAPSATLTASGSAQYSLATSSGISVGGSAGVYAGFFVGSGAALTGVVSADPTKVAKSGDAMNGPLTLSGS